MTNESQPMNYDTPITSPEHAEFCCKEAERRYGGTIIRDEYNMLLVRDEDGIEHTDQVLRALSFQSGCRPTAPNPLLEACNEFQHALGASAALLEHRLEEINGVLAAELYECCRAVALGDPYAYSALSPMVMAVSWITELTGNGDR